MHNPIPPSDPGYPPKVAARRKAWGALPIVFAIVLILAALAYAVRYHEWTGYVFAAFVALVLYFVGLRDVDRSRGN